MTDANKTPALRFWSAGGSLLTTIADSHGRKAVSFVEDEHVPDLVKWFDANPEDEAAADFKAALAARDLYRRFIHAD